MQIAGYEPITPFVTAGSGNARWCVVQKDGKRYFLKQFLSPVQPVQTPQAQPELLQKRLSRCAAFEQRKQALYNALARVPGESVVRAHHFFVLDGHYYAVSDYIDPSYPSFKTIQALPGKMILRLLLSLAECLAALHTGGVVHADLKPEHILVDNRVGVMQVRLIDFDSGFLESDPPNRRSKIDVDPVYLAPETYLLMTGGLAALNRKIDTFAFGILLCQALTGELPRFEKAKYTYLYACVLDGGRLWFPDPLPPRQRAFLQSLLQKNPAKRPGDDQICEFLRSQLSQKR